MQVIKGHMTWHDTIIIIMTQQINQNNNRKNKKNRTYKAMQNTILNIQFNSIK